MGRSRDKRKAERKSRFVNRLEALAAAQTNESRIAQEIQAKRREASVSNFNRNSFSDKESRIATGIKARQRGASVSSFGRNSFSNKESRIAPEIKAKRREASVSSFTRNSFSNKESRIAPEYQATQRETSMPVLSQNCSFDKDSEIHSPINCRTLTNAAKTTEEVIVYGSYKEFSTDFLNLLKDTSTSDTTIKCGTKIIKVHKNILGARSSVFKAIFNTDMRKTAEGAILIEDLTPLVLRDLIIFIYSNQVRNLSVSKAFDLLEASEKYQLQDLKKICINFLLSNMSEENVLSILPKAELYDKTLKTHTMNFISKNFSNLKLTKEWKSMQLLNPSMALEVCNKVIENLSGNE